MGKRKQSAPQKSAKANAEQAAAPKRPKVKDSAQSKQREREITISSELSPADAEIGEIALVNTSGEAAAGNATEVRLVYLNHSRRGFGTLAVEELAVEISDESGSVLTASLDAAESVYSSLLFLVKKQFVGLSYTNMKVRVFVTAKLFLVCEADQSHLCRTHLQSLILWLRPELSLDSIYGPKKSSSGKNTIFDPSSFYEAIKRSMDAPCLDLEFDELVPKLRTYQQQAVHWMVQREKGSADENAKHPLWVKVEGLDNKCSFYYNVFNGMVSREPRDFCTYVRGGILADEMGLGKTVEVLACILANRYQGVTQLESVLKKLRDDLDECKRERIDCVCDDGRDTGLMVQCDHCDAWQHAACVGYSRPKTQRSKKRARDEEDDDSVFSCEPCAEVIANVEVEGLCGATLVVCPTPILKQWQDEITRHIKANSLKVLVYEGVKRGCSMLDRESSFLKRVGAHDLAAADIVITTYDVLREDLFHDAEDVNQRSMRFQKRYQVIATPLTKLQWWRVCLDEAQMVECSTARATEMALRLHAQHRWCVSGTPIQRGLDDLHGLLSFLQADPFGKHSWWMQAMKQPYEEGRLGVMDYTHAFFREFMWRSMKHEVVDQLNIPPQEEQVTWLKFSSIESHFYRQQHEQCATKAREVIAKCSAGDRHLNHLDATKLMKPLLRLRQACCHPQAGASGIRSLQESPMTMDQILEVLIERAKFEAEEAQRGLVYASNALAGLRILENDISAAVAIYREALAITEENACSFRLDPLQKLHILHNLDDVLRNDKASSIPRTLRDDLLSSQCKNIRREYMSIHQDNLAAAQHDFYEIHKKIVDIRSLSCNWWLGAFSMIDTRDFVDKVKETLTGMSRSASSLALRFNDINGLKYLMQQELDAIDENRNRLLERLLRIDEEMESPNPDYVKRAGRCCRCQLTYSGIICVHCDLEILFQGYANRLLFLVSQAAEKEGVVSAEEALLAQQRALAVGKKKNGEKYSQRSTRESNAATAARVLNRRSETEHILTMLLAYVKNDYEEDGIAAANKHLEYLETLRNEYPAARKLAMAQQTVLFELNELNDFTTRLCLRTPAEDENDTRCGVHSAEIPQMNAEFTAQKFKASDDLTRAKGQLRYLKSLARGRGNSKEVESSAGAGAEDNFSEEACPICHENLETQVMILPCGHLLCRECLTLVVKRTHAPRLKRIACPTCRHQVYASDVALVEARSNARNKTDEIRMPDLEEEKENEEARIDVKGSYGTKIEAIVRRILKIQADDPFAKVLVFSTWNDVLGVLAHALATNKILLLRTKGRRKWDATILKFKQENFQVLLLPIQQGANGLNLVEAQHVILVEPLLNPAAEAQAMNRVHRIGQCCKTLVHRFIIRNSVEENIYKFGQRKLLSSSLPMKQKEQPLTASDMNDLLGCDEPETKDDESSLSLRHLSPRQAAAAAAEARLQRSFD